MKIIHNHAGKEIVVDTKLKPPVLIPDAAPNEPRQFYCCCCNTLIPDERIEAIRMLKPEFSFDCIECAKANDKKVKGFYDGASGVSDLNIVRDLGDEQHLMPDDQREEINESCLIGDEFM
jgi:hypothetical protein